MKLGLALSVIVLGLAACDGRQATGGHSASPTAERVEPGVRVSGYARIGVSVRN